MVERGYYGGVSSSEEPIGRSLWYGRSLHSTDGSGFVKVCSEVCVDGGVVCVGWLALG